MNQCCEYRTLITPNEERCDFCEEPNPDTMFGADHGGVHKHFVYHAECSRLRSVYAIEILKPAAAAGQQAWENRPRFDDWKATRAATL